LILRNGSGHEGLFREVPEMAEVRPYYSDKGLAATFYDLTTAADRGLDGDIDLYAGLAPPGGAVLELGAGTGRVSLALAERGLGVLGIDLAPTMLAQAEVKLAQAPAEVRQRVRFRRGDMAALNLGETFDAVIAPYFALAHLPAGSGWRNVFAGVARHLRPGGRAAFHLPSKAMLDQPLPKVRGPVLQRALEDGRRLSLFIQARTTKPAVGRYDQVVEYVVEGPGGVESRSLDRMTYYLADPAPAALAAGLEPEPTVMLGQNPVHLFRKPA
jgi:SAM-dependent methyltransferase